MYSPKLPYTGVSFLMLGVASFYSVAMLLLLILTLSVILFRFTRLLRKEGKIKKFLVIILLSLSMISLLIVLITCFGKMEANNKLNQSDQLLNNYINTLPNPTNNSVSPIKSLATPVTSLESSKINNSNDYPKSGEILGLIYIEKISLKLPIIEDSNDNNLWLGATHVRGTPLPWEKGNSFLASHNTNIYGKLFTRLNELTIGDKLTISTSKGKFTYVVYDTEIVPPDDTKCFQNIKGDYNLSLTTCTKYENKRVIVFCERIPNN